MPSARGRKRERKVTIAPAYVKRQIPFYEFLGEEGRIRVLLHSIAFGNLKLIAPEKVEARSAGVNLAERLGVDAGKLTEVADELLRLARTCVQGSSMAFASVRPEASGKISFMSSWMSSSIFLVLAAGSFVEGGGVGGGLLRERPAAALAAGELI